MAKSNHRSDSKFLKKHVEVGSVEGGACLNRHESNYVEKSCAHRWQAFKKAEENSGWYDFPAYKSLVGNSASPPIQTAVWGHFLQALWRPRPGSWDLHASSFRGMFPNFRGWSKAPYWHQAHHLIPNGVLNGCITEVSKESRVLYFAIRSGLLGAKYNLNHKDNMIILPMGKAVAGALGLPRHIAGIEAEPGVRNDVTAHKVYSANVEKEVKKVLRRYASQVDSEKHEEDADDVTKAELETISENLFIRLREWGAAAKGLPVDAIPAQMFTGLC